MQPSLPVPPQPPETFRLPTDLDLEDAARSIQRQVPAALTHRADPVSSRRRRHGPTFERQAYVLAFLRLNRAGFTCREIATRVEGKIWEYKEGWLDRVYQVRHSVRALRYGLPNLIDVASTERDGMRNGEMVLFAGDLGNTPNELCHECGALERRKARPGLSPRGGGLRSGRALAVAVGEGRTR